MPFGTGARLCAGFNLFHLITRIVIVGICRDFDIIIPSETTPESMEQRFAFVSTFKAVNVPMVANARTAGCHAKGPSNTAHLQASLLTFLHMHSSKTWFSRMLYPSIYLGFVGYTWTANPIDVM